MKYVTISDATMNAIRGASEHEFRQTGVRTGPDQWRVPLQDDTYERIVDHQLPGEPLDACILRMVLKLTGKGNN